MFKDLRLPAGGPNSCFKSDSQMKRERSQTSRLAWPRFADWRAAWLCLASFLGFFYAHGDLHEQIEAITARIEKDPDNAELYLKRGELRRAHREWAAAQADFDRVANMNPALDTVELSRGLLWMEMGEAAQAEKALGRFLSNHPDHVVALAAHARSLVRLGRFRDGAVQFTRALAAKPLPEFYLERARALAKADTENLRDVVRGLDEGLARLGPVVTLQVLALDLELQMPDYPAALSRLDAITLHATRKEVWLARRGDVLQQAGREAEAKVAWEAALVALAQLPIERRDTRAMKTLESHVRASLQGAR